MIGTLFCKCLREYFDETQNLLEKRQCGRLHKIHQHVTLYHSLRFQYAMINNMSAMNKTLSVSNSNEEIFT